MSRQDQHIILDAALDIGDINAVRFLLKGGLKPSKNALLKAATKGYLSIVQLFLQHGAIVAEKQEEEANIFSEVKKAFIHPDVKNAILECLYSAQLQQIPQVWSVDKNALFSVKCLQKYVEQRMQEVGPYLPKLGFFSKFHSSKLTQANKALVATACGFALLEDPKSGLNSSSVYKQLSAAFMELPSQIQINTSVKNITRDNIEYIMKNGRLGEIVKDYNERLNGIISRDIYVNTFGL